MASSFDLELADLPSYFDPVQPARHAMNPEELFSRASKLHDSLRPLYDRIDALLDAQNPVQQIPDMLTLAANLHTTWTALPQTLSVSDLSMFALAMFRFSLQDDDTLNLCKITQNFHFHIKPIILLQQCLCRAMAFLHASSTADMHAVQDSMHQLTQLKHVIARFKAHVESLACCHAVVSATSLMEVNPTDCAVSASFPDMNTDLKNPMHCLVDFILARLRVHQYVLSGDQCCELQFIKVGMPHTEDNLTRTVCKRTPTQHWRRTCSLEEFIKQQCDRETNFENWKMLTARDMMRRLINHFCGLMELQLNPNRHWFSFANGIYDAHDMAFYLYHEVHLMPREPGVSRACIALFEKAKFNVAAVSDEVDMPQKLMEIPTPVFDSIFKAQKFEAPVMQWIYAFFGRMFYPLHKWDRWSVIPLFVGKPNTGKTTIGNLLLKIFNPHHVGRVSSNMNSQFMLETLLNRLLWIWFDVTSNHVDLATLRLMISGQSILVPRMFKKELLVKWESPGMLIGDERLPTWPASFMARHVVTFSFDHAIGEPNPDLLEDLCAELGSIIPKVTMTYRRLAQEHGHKDIWSVLPSYFL
jgi:hypothetical protein